ncbi:MAG: glycoside hydrolase family 3 C-terminal domain-containing protein [Clostridia bacterium]|nr:glycoside hydrolase family 3 C-terminal domain-containing protein [Clostridia bacterium]
MLKHQQIIEKLTTEQKLDLIVDVTSLGKLPAPEKEFKFIKSASLNSKNDWLEYPSFAGLVNSWDVNLIGRVTDDILARGRDLGLNLVELPDSGFKISPYSEGASEDPLLSAKIAREMVLSGARSGVATCLCDPYVKKADGVYMDKEYSPRMRREFFGLPYEYMRKGNVKTLKLSKPESEWEYTKANDKILSYFKDKAVIIYDGGEKGDFVKKAINEGKFFVNGCREALTDAIENYEKLMKSVDACEIGVSDVNRACESGMALSPEMIDNAVDRILCFAEDCSSVEKTIVEAEEPKKKKKKKKAVKPLSVIAGEDSIVMLKNLNKALPLKRKEKVCLIGKLADGECGIKEFLTERTLKKKAKLIGYAEGYGEQNDISNDYLVEAEKLAKQCSTVILAVGLDEEQSKKARQDKNMRLPANQEVLVNRICKISKKVILLVYGDNAIDMSFDRNANAVLLLPTGGSAVAEATFNVLYGKGCPGGRLANTMYEDTDKIFSGIKRCKDSGRNEIGIFHGYRLYTSLKRRVKYPFGFGLSYTKFRYSKFKIKKGCVYLKVKNKGKKEGAELIQFYVSKFNSTSMRAERELKAFYKVRLKPKKKIKLIFKLADLDLTVFSESKRKWIKEKGVYKLSVCKNASDVLMSARFTVAGEETGDKPFVKSKYFQTVSNIKDGEYYLEEPTPAPKFPYEKTRKFAVGWSYLAGFLFSIYLYLYLTKWVGGGIFGLLLAGGLTLAPIILNWVMKSRKNKFIKKHIAKNKIMKKEKRSKIDFDLICEEIPYEQLFVEEFESTVLEIEKEDDKPAVAEKEEVFVNEVFNPDFTMKKAVEDLTTYMKERGIYVDVDSIRSLFASFASSKLVVLNADDKQLLSEFIDLLGKYFECENVGVNFADIQEQGGDIINTVDDVTPIATALMNKDNYRESIRIMSVKDIESDQVKSCLQQVIRYVEQPDKEILFSVLKDGKSYPLSPNVWFVLTLKDGQKAVDIPKYILESACVLDLMMRPVEEEPKKQAKVETVKEVKEKEPEIKEEIAPKTETTETTESETVTSEIVETETAELETEEKATETVDAVEETAVTEQEETLAENEEVKEETQTEEESEEVEETPKTPVELITYYQFSKMVDKARVNNVLDETLWKRLDKLEDFVISVDGTYRVNNKMWQRIEKYVSVYLSSGGSSEEAIDNVVAYHVINTMIPSVANGKNKDNVKFASVLENVFGEGHVPHSIKAVKATGLKI